MGGEKIGQYPWGDYTPVNLEAFQASWDEIQEWPGETIPYGEKEKIVFRHYGKSIPRKDMFALGVGGPMQ